MKIIKVDLGERGYSIHIGNSILSDKKIFDKANKLGLICFSTPFDVAGVNFLEKLNSNIIIQIEK